jgi:hypothetical protein
MKNENKKTKLWKVYSQDFLCDLSDSLTACQTSKMGFQNGKVYKCMYCKNQIIEMWNFIHHTSLLLVLAAVYSKMMLNAPMILCPTCIHNFLIIACKFFSLFTFALHTSQHDIQSHSPQHEQMTKWKIKYRLASIFCSCSLFMAELYNMIMVRLMIHCNSQQSFFIAIWHKVFQSIFIHVYRCKIYLWSVAKTS